MTKKSAKTGQWQQLSPKTRKIVTISSAVTVFLGTIISINKAAPIMEPWAPAHRMYVRDYADGIKNELQTADTGNSYILRDLQIEQAEGKRDAAKNDITKWNLELAKTKDPSTRALIDKTIIDLNANYEKLQEQIRTLTKMRAALH